MADSFADIFVWIDYGIFHVPGVTVRIIEQFLRRVENEQAIAIPGKHGRPIWIPVGDAAGVSNATPAIRSFA